MNILDEICKKKIQEVEVLKKERNFKSELKNKKQRDFLKTLILDNKEKYNIIAEIKRKSPSRGIIRENFDLINIAQNYKKAGAKCLSILTEKNFFGGDISFIRKVKEKIDIPILRKDFILDEWQIYESNFFGADCILLILAILDDSKLLRFYEIAKDLGMDVIFEVHDESELSRALKYKFKCIGINNRNLKNLKIDLKTFNRLSKKIPEHVIKICESGIDCNNQLEQFSKQGANAFLIGESLMKSNNIFESTKSLIKK